MSSFTAKMLIQKRQELWQKNLEQSYEDALVEDRSFREATAEHILLPENRELLNELREYPEYLIELFFIVVDKDMTTIPFVMNDVQRIFVDKIRKAVEEKAKGKRNHLRFIVLKGRQQGFTTIITALQLAYAITKRNFSGFTLADELTNTEAILVDKGQFFFENLPDALKPTTKFVSKSELYFDKINSKWRTGTAGSENVGRSRTLSFFHGSEAGFWTNLKAILKGLGEALTANSIQILETTANGYNEFKEMWDSGIYENCFFEWFLTPEYEMKFETEVKEEWFKQQVMSQDINADHKVDDINWVFTRCLWLLENKWLTWEQLYWYYNKWETLKRDIQQEYPCMPEEAFLASGNCHFNVTKIINRIEQLKLLEATGKLNIKRGYFHITYNDAESHDKIVSYRWVNDKNGYIEIYEDYIDGHPYVIGGDTAGEGRDSFTATVKNNYTGKRVASLKNPTLQAYEYAAQVYALGMTYGKALVAIESNYTNVPHLKLDEWRYRNQYIRTQLTDMGEPETNRYGFQIDKVTRPMLIDNFKEVIEERIELIYSMEELLEALTFVKKKNGKLEHEDGKHDDLLFSDFIAETVSLNYRTYPAAQPKPKPKGKLIDQLRGNIERTIDIDGKVTNYRQNRK